MANVVVTGAQWGDEGKGKIVDWLSHRADCVARFQGGHNAGHTLVVHGKTYKLSLLPSGVVRGKLSVIGSGVVLDPWALLQEIDTLNAQGIKITPENLVLDETCPLILPLHSELDALRENRDDSMKIGTTRRGIGPAYEDKVARRALRLCDLKDEMVFQQRIDDLIDHHNALRRGYQRPIINKEKLITHIKEISDKVIPFIGPVWHVLNQAERSGKKILFEGAQGTLLDVDHGTYPYVTSSNTLAGQAATGCGISPHMLNYILGIVKAYSTRVGEGPFPTELKDKTGEQLGKQGREFGTVTGRVRRCGWLDSVSVRQALMIGGVDGIVLTKLDVLDQFETLKICTSYRLGDKILDRLPANLSDQLNVEPIYEVFNGWKRSTRKVRSWNELPSEAIKYIRRIEELISVPISMISTSPEREDVILIKDPFED